MAEEAARSRLGRGLAALIGDVDEETTLERARGQRRVPIEALRHNPRNPRQLYSDGQDDIARIVGKSRSHVTNTLRLLKLPDAVKAYLQEGKISAGHARALLGQPDPERMARVIVEQGLNVRQVEAIGQERAAKAGKSAKRRQRAEKDADTLAVEKRLADALGLIVTLEHRGSGGE